MSPLWQRHVAYQPLRSNVPWLSAGMPQYFYLCKFNHELYIYFIPFLLSALNN
jgi:hypothetical protein